MCPTAFDFARCPTRRSPAPSSFDTIEAFRGPADDPQVRVSVTPAGVPHCVLAVSQTEAAAFAILILLALVAIGALFYVFLASDNRE